jgi:hypothetical protein
VLVERGDAELVEREREFNLYTTKGFVGTYTVTQLRSLIPAGQVPRKATCGEVRRGIFGVTQRFPVPVVSMAEFTDLDASFAEAKMPLTVTTPASMPDSSGRFSCPKCSKTGIRRAFGGWGGVSASVLLLFLNNKALQIEMENETQHILSPGGFIGNGVSADKLDRMQQDVAAPFYVINALLVVFGLWMLYIALFGKTTCKACGYRWRAKAKA